MKRTIEPHFGPALRMARLGRGVAQEEFDGVSGRTYISSLERGLKQPTLGKVSALAGVLGMHPLSLMTLAFCKDGSPAEVHALLTRVAADLAELAESVR